MLVTIAHSEDIDSADAIREVLAASEHQLSGVVPHAGILVASIEHDFDVLQKAILGLWPDLELIGCCGDGEISSIAGATDDSVALMLLASDRIRFRAGFGRDVVADPVAACRDALAMARREETEPPSLCVIMPEGWELDVVRVLETVQQELGPQTLVVGGLTTDARHDQPTVQAYRGETAANSIACLLFYGPLNVSSAVNSGMQPVGAKHRVTKADGPFVQTIDGRPAEDLWVDTFGKHSIFYPLAVYPEDDQQFYIAATPFIDEERGAYFWNPIPEGSVVQLADVTQDELLSAATQTCDEAIASFPGAEPAAGLVFSCAGRKAMLGTRVNEEIDLLRSRLGKPIPLIGFYTSGELCPLRGQTTTRDHGYTFVSVLIGEE